MNCYNLALEITIYFPIKVSSLASMGKCRKIELALGPNHNFSNY